MNTPASPRPAIIRWKPTRSAEKIVASVMISTSLPGSDGWNVKPPNRNHAWAPLMLAPKSRMPNSKPTVPM